MKPIPFAVVCAVASGLMCSAADSSQAADKSQPLWQIGHSDRGIAEFALAPADYSKFLLRFGSPDRAYYVGLSKPESDWPYVLPGPLENWAGSSGNGRWDQMNTLPIGFVLEQAPAAGDCVLSVDLCDTHPQNPPRLRVTNLLPTHSLLQDGHPSYVWSLRHVW